MRRSRYLLRTLKETPKEAVVVSHQLMLRAGMIKQLASGIYSYLPFGLRSIRKIEDIIRQELAEAGCQELLMPSVQPAELWMDSGRWQNYGKELLRFEDRKENAFCFGPTHEEVITDIVRREIRSYKDLPLNLFQIQTKFRDEIRPRFGLMRGREFIMKDGYSFDIDEERATDTYWIMYEAYQRIFARCGLEFLPVEADSGAIGGSYTHEFHVLANSGEDEILSCAACSYAANVERCEVHVEDDRADPETTPPDPKQVTTPKIKTIEQLSDHLQVEPSTCVKTVLYLCDEKPVAVCVCGHREVNETALKNHLDAVHVAMVTDDEVMASLGLVPGFLGPIGLPDEVTLLMDPEIWQFDDVVVGGNLADIHLTGVVPHVHLKAGTRASVRLATAVDPCPRCKEGALGSSRGIEVGQVFKLGTKYSEPMEATFLDQDGSSRPVVMGCYGIGVGRTMAAAIEQNHDDAGIIWPAQIAPFQVMLINLDAGDGQTQETADSLYHAFEVEGVEVLYDDTAERPGFKFKDADLLGLPVQVIVGRRSLKQGKVDLKIRKSGDRKSIPVAQAVDAVIGELRLLGWENGRRLN